MCSSDLSSCAVLNHCLCLAEFDYGALRRRSKRVIADVVNGHPQVQALTYFENTSGIIKHFADSKIEAIKLGTRRNGTYLSLQWRRRRW